MQIDVSAGQRAWLQCPVAIPQFSGKCKAKHFDPISIPSIGSEGFPMRVRWRQRVYREKLRGQFTVKDPACRSSDFYEVAH